MGVWSGEVSGPGECLLGGGLVPGGVWSQGGVPPLGGGLLLGDGIPACTEADPPVNRMTNRCKNITLVTTLLRPLKKHTCCW